MMQARRAIVAGAGIAGLSAALALNDRGWMVDLFEAAPRLEAIGAGIQLGPNATRILARLGVLPFLHDYAVEPQRMRIHRPDGSETGGLALGAAARARWGAPFMAVHRGDLQQALLAAVRARPDISLALDMPLSALEPGPEGTVATFDGPGDATVAEGALFVGADGVRSAARMALGLQPDLIDPGYVAWRGLVPREGAPLYAREPAVHLWLGPGTHVVHYPVRGGREINIVVIEQSQTALDGWSAPGDPDHVGRLLRGWMPGLRDLAAAAPGWLGWRLVGMAPFPRWTEKTAVLVGDAAHPVVPFLAQGGALAIEDGAVLADQLAAAPSVLEGLARFVALRRARCTAVQRESLRNGQIYHLGGPLAFARGAVLSVMGEKGLARRYDWLYGFGQNAEVAPA